MKKEIKKMFDFLGLEYNATVEDIKLKQKILLKVARAKEVKTGKKYTKKISKINLATEQILDYLKEYDNSHERTPFFRTNASELSTLVYAFLLIVMITICAFFALIK